MYVREYPFTTLVLLFMARRREKMFVKIMSTTFAEALLNRKFCLVKNATVRIFYLSSPQRYIK